MYIYIISLIIFPIWEPRQKACWGSLYNHSSVTEQCPLPGLSKCSNCWVASLPEENTESESHIFVQGEGVFSSNGYLSNIV